MPEKEKDPLYQCCKICGIPLPQRFVGLDLDYTQQHAFLYHLELTDDYSPQQVRDLIEKGKVWECGLSD